MSTDLRIEQLMMRSHRGQSLINQFDGWDLRQRVFVIALLPSSPLNNNGNPTIT